MKSSWFSPWMDNKLSASSISLQPDPQSIMVEFQEFIQSKSVNDLLLAISEGVKEGTRLMEEAKAFLDGLNTSINDAWQSTTLNSWCCMSLWLERQLCFPMLHFISLHAQYITVLIVWSWSLVHGSTTANSGDGEPCGSAFWQRASLVLVRMCDEAA